MEYRALGLSGLRVSAVGLGCMGMSHGYGLPADKREMSHLLEDAVDMGYTLFDTAEIYGTVNDPHTNEELLGKALHRHRDRIVLATKFGLAFDDPEGDGPHPLIPRFKPGSNPMRRRGLIATSAHRPHRPILSTQDRPHDRTGGCGGCDA